MGAPVVGVWARVRGVGGLDLVEQQRDRAVAVGVDGQPAAGVVNGPYQLGELLSSAGEYRQAERVYRRILSITPDDDIALAKANAMSALGEQRAG